MPLKLENREGQMVLSLIGDVGTEITAQLVRDQLRQAGDSPLDVQITTRGGSVIEGHAIFAMLEAHAAGVDTTVVGGAMSAGAIIAQAGRRRRMHSNALMMVHGAMTGSGASTLQEHQSAVQALEATNDAIAETLVQKTGQTPVAIRALMDRTTFMSAQQALDLGFIDEIVDSVLPADAGVLAILNQRLIADGPTNGSQLSDVARMARAAGIAPGTVNQILEASINCPPRARLAGFARALGVGVDSLLAAARRDGCTYGDENMADNEAASVAEIKNACPGADADFVLAHVEAGATLEHVKDAWSTHLAAELAARDEKIEALSKERDDAQAAAAKKTEDVAAKSGTDPVNSGGKPVGGDSAGDDPVAQWHELVAQERKKGLPQPKAVRNVAIKHPELRAAMVEAANA